jgi:hypothetical protein
MMTKKSTRSTATFANVYAMLDRDELRANGIPVKDETPFVERTIGEPFLEALRRLDVRPAQAIAILLERLQGLNRSAADRRRYYEAS